MHKVHVVHAHPEPRSFCTAMAHEAQRLLELRGDDVSFSDLYALNFDPVVRASDFSERANRDYLVYAKEHFSGGHFAPAEEPERVIEDIRATFRNLR